MFRSCMLVVVVAVGLGGVGRAVTVDRSPPTGGRLTATAGNATINLSWGGFADRSGVASFKLVGTTGTRAPANCLGAAVYAGTATSFTQASLTNGTLYSYRVCAIDAAGNMSVGSTLVTASARPRPEFDAPVGSVVINAGAARTARNKVALAIAATDASAVTSMCLAEKAPCTNWVGFAAAVNPFTLSSAPGNKTVFLWLRDEWGNESSTPVSDGIVLDNAPPVSGTARATSCFKGLDIAWSGFSDRHGSIAAYKLFVNRGRVPMDCSGTPVYEGLNTSYTANNLVNTYQYTYRVCAVDADGNVTPKAVGGISNPMTGSTCAVGGAVPGTFAYQTRNIAGLAFDFAKVDKVSFVRGAVSGDGEAYAEELPRHNVTLQRDFWISKTEVTQQQFMAVMKPLKVANPSKFVNDQEFPRLETRPVENVTWKQAVDFCNRLSELDGLEPVYDSEYVGNLNKLGYRLPTEAEWELAARAGTSGSRYGSLSDIAWTKADSGHKTRPVGQKDPNALGLYDMLGNVWEWTHDWYFDYPSWAVTDPVGALSGDNHTIRGGSWYFAADRNRASVRVNGMPANLIDRVGFRIARSLEVAPPPPPHPIPPGAPPGTVFWSGGRGDGWDVFFDNSGHVFNIFHHNSPKMIDCHTRAGGGCGPGWPFSLAGYNTGDKSPGWVDLIRQQVWWNTNTTTRTGFGCVDVSDMAVGPRMCGAGAAPFVALGTAGSGGHNATLGLAEAAGLLFTLEPTTGKLLCLDPSGNGGVGSACPGQPFNPAGLTKATAIHGFADRIYYAGLSGATPTVDCWDAVTESRCTGLWPLALSFTPSNVFEAPTLAGAGDGACFIAGASRACFDPDGVPVTYGTMPAYNVGYYNNNPSRVGSRIYSTNGSEVQCWDAASGATCPNYPLRDSNYAVVVDPSNGQCLWTNDDPGYITTWNAVAGTNTCSVTFLNCNEIRVANPSAVSGVYPLDPDGNGPLPVMNAYCDMSTSGGGWTRIFGIRNATGVNRQANGLALDTGLLAAAREEGHVRPTELQALRAAGWFSEMRFDCRKTTVGRRVHINATAANVLDYFSALTDTFPVAAGSFTVLAGDNSLLSGLASEWGRSGGSYFVNRWSHDGMELPAGIDERFFNHAFFRQGQAHWMVGAGPRWECDDIDVAATGDLSGYWHVYVR